MLPEKHLIKYNIKKLNLFSCDVLAQDNWGLSPVHRAAKNAHSKVIELLAARGADLNCKDMWRYRPVHRAAENGHNLAVQLLIELGCKVLF